MWKLRSRLRAKARLFPEVFDTSRLRGLTSLRDFDDKITAYYCGFEGASDYYERSAAANVVDRIAVPAFILHAANDPFIRILPETTEENSFQSQYHLRRDRGRRPLFVSRRA